MFPVPFLILCSPASKETLNSFLCEQQMKCFRLHSCHCRWIPCLPSKSSRSPPCWKHTNAPQVNHSLLATPAQSNTISLHVGHVAGHVRTSKLLEKATGSIQAIYLPAYKVTNKWDKRIKLFCRTVFQNRWLNHFNLLVQPYLLLYLTCYWKVIAFFGGYIWRQFCVLIWQKFVTENNSYALSLTKPNSAHLGESEWWWHQLLAPRRRLDRSANGTIRYII